MNRRLLDLSALPQVKMIHKWTLLSKSQCLRFFQKSTLRLRNGLTKDDEVDGDLLGAELVLDGAAPLAAPLRARDVAQQDGAGGHDDAPAAAARGGGGGGEHLAPRVGPAATDKLLREGNR